MFTRRLKQLVGNAAADIGSQPVPTEVSPAKPVGKKHVGKCSFRAEAENDPEQRTEAPLGRNSILFCI